MVLKGLSKSALGSLQPLFETALDAVVAMWQDGTVAEWNHAAERTFGWTKEEALGRLMADLIVPPSHRAAHLDGLLRYNRTGEGPILNQRLEVTAIDRDERQFPIELSITVTEAGGEKLFIGFLRDISERKRSEELLVRQAREAELLFRLSQLAAESETVEPVLKETLKVICELAGWPVGHALIASPDRSDELVSTDVWHGRKSAQFKKLRDVTRSIRFRPGVGLPGRILETGEPAWMSDTESETTFMRKGLGYAAAFGFPLKNAKRIVAVLEFFTVKKTPPNPDLLLTVRTLGEQVGRVFERSTAMAKLRQLNETLEERVIERTIELKTAHEALRQAQKMEAIGQLTGGIAHDFNNLLTIIRGSADVLRRQTLSPDKQRRYLEAISDTADRAAKLTSQLLAFARRQPLKPELFDVAERIHAIADMLRTILGSRIQLIIDADCTDCFVQADVTQFETALVNLIVNARDAMTGEGTLTIAVRAGVSTEGSEVVLVSIEDTGCGIPAEQLDHIFEPFYTTKQVGKGTGLGLSQVYGFIKQSNGDIQVESEQGEGATFILSLPRMGAGPELAVAKEAPPEQHAAISRVLVVEDNVEVAEFATQLLSELGFETSLATTASEALDKLERKPDGFDLIFSDVVMPGMNGVEFGKQVHERWPGIPVVLTTGYSEALADETSHGFPILRKPYSADGLVRVLRGAGRKDPTVSS